MTSYLVAATAAAGHVEPALPIVRALVDAGHDVRATTGAASAARFRAAGARVLPGPPDAFPDIATVDERFPQRAALTGPRQLRFDLEHVFVAPAAAQARHLLAEHAREPADVLLVDTGLVGGWLAREAGGPPLAVYGVTVFPYASADLPPFGLAWPPRAGSVRRWRDRVLGAALRRAVAGPSAPALDRQRAMLGLAPAGRTALDWNDAVDLYLQLAPAGFDYPRGDLPEVVHAIGSPSPLPVHEWRPPAWWAELDGSRPVVAVTQGTVATDPAQLLRAALRGLDGTGALVVAVTGGTDPGELGPLPADARAVAFVPYGELLDRADVLVTNGGFGGVTQAIARGVPLVVAGRTEDKAEVAARVAWAGVGVDLRTERPEPAAVAAAVGTVLADPSYAERARALSATAPPAPAADHAVQLLERLAATRGPVVRDAAVSSPADGSRALDAQRPG